jgi:hypothetical protein
MDAEAGECTLFDRALCQSYLAVPGKDDADRLKLVLQEALILPNVGNWKERSQLCRKALSTYMDEREFTWQWIKKGWNEV